MMKEDINQNKRYDFIVQMASIIGTLNISKEALGALVEDLFSKNDTKGRAK